MRGIKLKSNPRSDDAGIAREVLDSCGPSFHLVIDPNGRWDSIEESIRKGSLVHDANPHTWIEDPTYSDRERWAEIARATGLRLICTVIGAKRVLEVAGVGISGLNLVGPWPDLIQASREASTAGLPFWAGSAVDTGLSDLAMLHFALTQPAFTLPTELAGSQMREHSLLSTPIPILEGCARPPEGDGMGIEPDYDAIERYTTESIVLGPP
jgi:muconate cycloisomerase